LARQPEHLGNILRQDARARKPMQFLSVCAIMRL
jgi:hypothetical protein